MRIISRREREVKKGPRSLQFRQWGRVIWEKMAGWRGECSAGLGGRKEKVWPKEFFLFGQG